MKIDTLNDTNYSTLIDDNHSSCKLIKFETSWCGPCKMLNTVITENLDKVDEKKLKIFVCDIEQSPDLTEKFNIQAVPVVLILDKTNTIKSTAFGAINKNDYLELIKDYLISDKKA